MLPGFHKHLLYLFLLLPVSLFAQTERETHAGASFSLTVEKDLSRFLTLSADEEVRIVDNNTGFDRSVTSAGMEYSLFDRKVKIGAYYAFIYRYNNDFLYETRHRCYLNLSYKETFEPFILSWRGRLQGTWRDESRGAYKINPKYVMKNKFEAAYMIWGSPWRPYLSCDLSTNLNEPVREYELLRVRYEGGVNWRLNRTTWMEFFLRYDEYLSGTDAHKLSVGATYKMKL
ncbi:MAG: DUF2490 domain-containing protein [Dysgonamonadaceae bacterium]|jgi:hypothetical protein|nr:DUF2490 domain-containing protein [Dysgonamonadaceae bacterium]